MSRVTSLPSRNHGWGFYGEARRSTDGDEAEAGRLFALVAAYLIRWFKLRPTVARDFLDSRCGRHFADALLGTARLKEPALGARGFGRTLLTRLDVAAFAPSWLAVEVRRFVRSYNARDFARSVS